MHTNLATTTTPQPSFTVTCPIKWNTLKAKLHLYQYFSSDSTHLWPDLTLPYLTLP